mgnify:CR=1 FL=1
MQVLKITIEIPIEASGANGSPKLNGCLVEGEARSDLSIEQQMSVLAQLVSSYVSGKARAVAKPTVLVPTAVRGRRF